MGGTKAVPIDVRVLAATNRDLEQAVAQGTFRKDLYFRLNVLTLRIPPLRQRKQDIPLLVGHFLERLARSTGVQRNISDDALKLMLAYDWPGNVRELENCIERACALTSGPTIHLADLPTTIQNWREQSRAGGRRADLAARHPADRRDGKAGHSGRHRAAARRQAGGRAPARHRQDHPLPQAERVRRTAVVQAERGPHLSAAGLCEGLQRLSPQQCRARRLPGKPALRTGEEMTRRRS